MTKFGANILPQFLTHDEKLAVRRWIKNELRPPEVVVMDDFGFAQDVVQDTGRATEVIYRAWDRRDHEWHNFQSAEEIYARHRPFMQPGIWAQVWNEPMGYADLQLIGTVTAKLCEWSQRDTPVQHRGRMGLALPHWAVGHPEDARIDAGEYDAGLIAIARYKQRFCGHEYAIASTVDEQPFRIGRIERSLQRAARIGNPIAGAMVSISEFGRDVGGGVEDGWQMVFAPDEYLIFMKGAFPTYKRLGIRCVHPFCVGRGADGNWRYFNIWGHPVITNGMTAYNEEEEDMSQDVGALVEAVVTSAFISTTPGVPSGSNVRQQLGTSFPSLGVLHKDDRIRISQGFVVVADLRWHQVQKLGANGTVVLSGWVADGSSFAWQVGAPTLDGGLTTAQRAQINGILASFETGAETIRSIVNSVPQ